MDMDMEDVEWIYEGNEQKNGHLAQLAEHWFEWIANQMDLGSNPTVMRCNGYG